MMTLPLYSRNSSRVEKLHKDCWRMKVECNFNVEITMMTLLLYSRSRDIIQRLLEDESWMQFKYRNYCLQPQSGKLYEGCYRVRAEYSFDQRITCTIIIFIVVVTFNYTAAVEKLYDSCCRVKAEYNFTLEVTLIFLFCCYSKLYSRSRDIIWRLLHDESWIPFYSRSYHDMFVGVVTVNYTAAVDILYEGCCRMRAEYNFNLGYHDFFCCCYDEF